MFDWFTGNSALTFAHPWLLLLLLGVPLLAYLRGKRGPAAALTFSSTASLRAIGKKSAARAGKILRTLLLASLAVFVIALARPQLGKSLTQIEASGIDIILALDVSGSMLTKDFTIGGQEATRVDAIREVTRKFIEGRPNDRIGIIAFAGRPYVVSPMTLDHDWLLQNLDRVRIGLVEDGTAIGSAIAAAANRLNDKHSKSRVLVLLTDGENNAGKIPPNTAAEAVKALKIHFYAIGAGINGIAPAPIFTTRGPLTDALGNILYENQRVEFNESGLREVAKIADGKFFRATDTASLEQIYTDIDKLEKSTVSVKKYQQYRDLFPICLMSGCGLLVPQLAGTVNRPRRMIRFGLQLLGFALAIVSLAQPRWGYTFEDVKRKGLDLLIAVDTSRSMLSNDVQPNRLERVKLAVQDLINELQGDRVGLIAFAGRAFLQAPLTIDYDAVVEAINDLDTKSIPEGGTNNSGYGRRWPNSLREGLRRSSR